jgi:hypothetical protein
LGRCQVTGEFGRQHIVDVFADEVLGVGAARQIRSPKREIETVRAESVDVIRDGFEE